METAKLRIVADKPPAKIIAPVTIGALAHSPINRVVPAPIPAPRGRRLDVDAILARSLLPLTLREENS